MNSNEIMIARANATAEYLAIFFQLADEWQLSIEEQKGLIGTKSIERLLQSLDRDESLALNDESISKLVMLSGIRHDLNSLYSNDIECASFIRSPCSDFDGLSPLLFMLKENSLENISSLQFYLKKRLMLKD